MKCARLHLQQRAKGKIKRESPTPVDKPRRYCQKRLVNPEHEEDPRWIDMFDRFHCNMNSDQLHDVLDSARAQQESEDIVLTVQTLKFQGDVNETKRPRTSFKYKKITDTNKHRMFVKQAVNQNSESDEDRSSQQTYYYFDDYVKYLCNSDRSRPTSGKSSIFLREFSRDKATQVELTTTNETKKSRKAESKIKNLVKKCPKWQMKDEIRDVSETIENTKITYEKTGKRKSLTISRAQSPETLQVIRVDVVCNYNSSPTLDYDENKNDDHTADLTEPIIENVDMKNNYLVNKYNNHFTTKYLLTNTIKSLDEKISGGAKVTLLCKTFKLSDRDKPSDKPGIDRKYTKTLKSKREKKVKSIKIKHNEVIY